MEHTLALAAQPARQGKSRGHLLSGPPAVIDKVLVHVADAAGLPSSPHGSSGHRLPDGVVLPALALGSSRLVPGWGWGRSNHHGHHLLQA